MHSLRWIRCYRSMRRRRNRTWFPGNHQRSRIPSSVPKSLIVQEDVSKFNATSLEARDIKIKITNIDIPVAFASAFEGEIIRRGDMQVEFDGSRVDCFELVQTKDASEVEDHKIEVIGPDFDAVRGWQPSIHIAYIVEVAGKSMQPDFRAGYSSVSSTAT